MANDLFTPRSGVSLTNDTSEVKKAPEVQNATRKTLKEYRELQ